MKKIIISLLLLIPIMVKADIDKMYIDSEVDIAGNLIVKEIIEVDTTNEFTLSLPYKSKNSKEYKENEIEMYNHKNLEVVEVERIPVDIKSNLISN